MTDVKPLNSPSQIRVLVVEDSPVARDLLVHILSLDPKIQVIGTVSRGEGALKAVELLKPDVITMDIHMPEMDGFETTRKIMETHPTPIVIVAENTKTKEVSLAMRAMEAGALAILQKPSGHPDYEAEAAEFVQTVKLISEVKVVRRWPRHWHKAQVLPEASVKFKQPAEIKVVTIGASTGGTTVLQTILSNLPKNFTVPVLIVQHMVKGFIQGFVEWLGQTSSLPVHIAQRDMHILPGHVYVAPDGFQMKIKLDGRISLTRDEPENGVCPSVSYLFRSVAEVFGKNAVGILLTGMGKDGAKELKLMKEKGAITIAQDKESSAIHGMPGEAINLGAAMYVLSPETIASALSDIVNNRLEEKGVN